jgi:hypothetical protein
MIGKLVSVKAKHSPKPWDATLSKLVRNQQSMLTSTLLIKNRAFYQVVRMIRESSAAKGGKKKTRRCLIL